MKDICVSQIQEGQGQECGNSPLGAAGVSNNMEVAELYEAVMASDNQESESTLIDALFGLLVSSGLELGFNTPTKYSNFLSHKYCMFNFCLYIVCCIISGT